MKNISILVSSLSLYILSLFLLLFLSLLIYNIRKIKIDSQINLLSYLLLLTTIILLYNKIQLNTKRQLSNILPALGKNASDIGVLVKRSPN